MPEFPTGIQYPKVNLRPPLFLGLLLFILLFGVGGIWMFFSRIEGAVIASGTVVVEGKPLVVQHLDGGIVEALHVSNHEKVEAGQLLITLDKTDIQTQVDIIRQRLLADFAKRSRLNSERDGESEIRFIRPEFDAEAFDSQNNSNEYDQKALFNARKEKRAGEESALREQSAQTQHEITGMRAVTAANNRRLGILQREYEALNALNLQGYAPTNQVRALYRDIESLKAQIAGDQAQLARLADRLDELGIREDQIAVEFSEALLAELQEVNEQIAENQEQFRRLTGPLNRLEILAPGTGMIYEMSVNTKGSVVPSGATLMKILPSSAPISIELTVQPQFIDQLDIGQDVQFVFSAFNSRELPRFSGWITSISPDRHVDEASGMAFYTVWAKLSDEELQKLGDRQLVPGMPVEAFIATGAQKPIEYLLKPLTDNLRRAMREE